MKEDIIKLAQEAGAYRLVDANQGSMVCLSNATLQRFAAIVADRCADIAYEAEPFHSADLIREAFGVEKC
ncbi:hypothetical protein UFOVP420_50 [uncultured Caudovirales phage]|jgi:hypothetical protein|uniref:Uncharacterized protein n=1 Tax=uncultured Caudovirales phage TaxID=2100421 RepID=A0A6J5M7V8_9CAUD|nr:hypothetical protein UFOVP420_50 [uncultured Caudovirales phage]